MFREHFDEQRRRKGVVATTITDDGQKLDWIVRDAQLARLTPPPEPPPVPEGYPPDPPRLRASQMGPLGTVPTVHWDADALPAESLTATVEEFYARTPEPQLQSAYVPVHVAANHVIIDQVFGTTGGMSIHDPILYQPNYELSLGQASVSAEAAPTVLQTVEAGWVKSNNIYPGALATRFFVYYTTEGYGGPFGNCRKNWVDDGCWYQESTSAWRGMLLSGGPGYEKWITIKAWLGGWWIGFNGTWVGGFPYTTFRWPGLAGPADKAQWHGEVHDYGADYVTTRTDMGSGQHASAHQAWFRGLQTFKQSTVVTFAGIVNSPGVTAPYCYSIQAFFNNPDPWGSPSFFYYGGPGHDLPSCP